MKLKYIDINGYGILVDESAEINNGELLWDNEVKEVMKMFKAPNKVKEPYQHKIIFAEKELNLDNVPILPDWREWEVEQYLEKESEKWCLINGYNPSDYVHSNRTAEYTRVKNIFIAGYNHNKAKYTEEDLIKAIEIASGERLIDKEIQIKSIIQSLQKFPKYIVMESKCGRCYSDDYNECWSAKECCRCSESYPDIPKLIINSKGRQEGIIKEIIYE